MLLKLVTFYAFVQGLNGFNSLLPSTTVPKSYSLTISPNFEKKEASFVGLVEIHIQTKAITSDVVLHSKDLKFTSVVVTDPSTERQIPLKEWEFSKEYEQAKIALSELLPPNREYIITIKFAGLLRNDMTGFYKSSYNDTQTGKVKFLAVTQFEATYARSAFPCYDEPHYKVPFNITVGVSENQIALSNMPVKYTDKKDDCQLENGRIRTWFHFEQTPSISTYLVAFFVGEFVSLESSSNVKVYTHLEYLQQTKYALDIAPKLLKAMEMFTGINYQLLKMDLLALPDLRFGAMENWGMNTFKERLLLLPDDSTTPYKGAVTKTIQHELSHQWFGNLVTCDWWDYVWLNEGFATFFEYFATAIVEPDWQLPEFFVVEQHQTALEYDQTTRHSISNNVSTPEEIDTTFDRITYNKGGSVLRMLYSYVGEDVFRESLNLYLFQHMKGSVKPNDLWNAFEETLSKRKQTFVKNQTVNAVMSTWTEQPGYPVVNVTKYKNEYYHDREDYWFRFTQERFTVDEPLVKHTTKWFIGISLTIDLKPNFDNSTPFIWLDPTVDVTYLKPPVESNKWYIANLQSTGFYRVNYEKENWLALIEQLKTAPKVIHVLNRAQLIDDSFNLARAGRLNYTVPLELTKYLDKENDVIPWYSVMNSYSYILDRMRRSHIYSKIESYVSDKALIIFTELLRQVTEEKNKNYAINASWKNFNVWACQLNVPTCMLRAIDFFHSWQKGGKIPDDEKDAAFCVGLKVHRDWDTWNQVFQVYLKTESASERFSALNALACSQTDSILRMYVELILNGANGPIRPQDYRAVFNSLSSTPMGIQTLLVFLRDNWERICKELTDGESVAAIIYSILASKVSLDNEILIMNEIRSKSGIPNTLQKSYDSVHKQVEINQKWFGTYSTDINEFVKPGSSKDIPISPHTSAASPINSIGSLSTITCLTIISIVILIIYPN